MQTYEKCLLPPVSIARKCILALGAYSKRSITHPIPIDFVIRFGPVMAGKEEGKKKKKSRTEDFPIYSYQPDAFPIKANRLA